MSVRQLRLEKGWSQEELSQLSGLSVRTIQRIEQGNKAGLESLKSLAAVFELQVSDLQNKEAAKEVSSHPLGNHNDEIDKMNLDRDKTQESAEKAAVIAQVKRIKAFNKSLISYLAIMLLLCVINLVASPGYLWVIWPALGWGVALLVQGLSAYEVINLFGADWEKKQIEKRLGKK